MMLLDEATRFKKAGTIEGQEADQLLYKPFWSFGYTTLDLLNDWCWISKCLSCPMKLERSSSALASIAAHVELQLVPVQNNTPERALLNDMFNWSN